jgi:hypothetical protein
MFYLQDARPLAGSGENFAFVRHAAYLTTGEQASDPLFVGPVCAPPGSGFRPECVPMRSPALEANLPRGLPGPANARHTLALARSGLERLSDLTKSSQHCAEAVEPGFQILDDLLSKFVGFGEVVEISKALVLEPENIEASFVAGS